MNLFEQDNFNVMFERINKFDKNTERQWGILEHAQMLAHCSKVIELALNTHKKQIFIGKLLGKYVVNKILNNKGATKRNVRSTKKLFIENPNEFEEEKVKLLELFSKFHENGATFYENKLHPFFGKLTAQQWNDLMYKHLHHHLSQFSS